MVFSIRLHKMNKKPTNHIQIPLQVLLQGIIWYDCCSCFCHPASLISLRKVNSPRSQALLVGSNVSPRDSINLNSPPFYTTQLPRFCNKAMFRLCPAWSFTALQILNHLYLDGRMYPQTCIGIGVTLDNSANTTMYP